MRRAGGRDVPGRTARAWRYGPSAFWATLLERGAEGDLVEAKEAIDRLQLRPADEGSAIVDITQLRLRALLARACGDDDAYRDLVSRYRAMLGHKLRLRRTHRLGRGDGHDGGWVGLCATCSRGRLAQPGRRVSTAELGGGGLSSNTCHRSASLRSGDAGCPRPWPRYRTARRPHTCSASWPIGPDPACGPVPKTGPFWDTPGAPHFRVPVSARTTNV